MKDVKHNSKIMIESYHATDKTCCESIEKDGFKIRANEKHWITNGVYFFLDYSHAEWWARQEHKNFGVKISEPAVIKVNILEEEKKICDSRKLNDYISLHREYLCFRKNLMQKGGVKNGTRLNKLNCAFFEFYKKKHKTNVFIIGFDKTQEKNDELAQGMRMPYVEYQMCVCSSNVINILGKVVRNDE